MSYKTIQEGLQDGTIVFDVDSLDVPEVDEVEVVEVASVDTSKLDLALNKASLILDYSEFYSQESIDYLTETLDKALEEISNAKTIRG